MRNTFVRLLTPALKLFGIVPIEKKIHLKESETRSLFLDIILRQQAERSTTPADGITFIIFSKDRTLQLDALLRSLSLHVTGAYSIEILYATSSPSHEAAYETLIKGQPTLKETHWKHEGDFKSDLNSILEKSKTEFVCFLVDDIIFIRPVNLSDIDVDLLRNGTLSLRLGGNVTYCYMRQKFEAVPILQELSPSSQLYQFDWRGSKGDWHYPASVDGHILPRSTTLAAANMLKFKAPNSFESALQKLNPIFLNRPGYCYAHSRLVNIPANCVQNEKNNQSAGLDPEEMRSQWENGLRVDINKLSNINTKGVHEEISLPLITVAEIGEV